MCGGIPISLSEIGGLLTGGAVSDMTHKVFFTLRLPRTLMAVLAGAGRQGIEQAICLIYGKIKVPQHPGGFAMVRA